MRASSLSAHAGSDTIFDLDHVGGGRVLGRGRRDAGRAHEESVYAGRGEASPLVEDHLDLGRLLRQLGRPGADAAHPAPQLAEVVGQRIEDLVGWIETEGLAPEAPGAIVGAHVELVGAGARAAERELEHDALPFDEAVAPRAGRTVRVTPAGFLATAAACSAAKSFEMGMMGAEEATGADVAGAGGTVDGSLAGEQPRSISEAAITPRMPARGS